jgi:uncharacterized MAPEG superfamily protein
VGSYVAIRNVHLWRVLVGAHWWLRYTLMRGIFCHNRSVLMTTETLIIVLTFVLALVHYLLPPVFLMPGNGLLALAGARDNLVRPESPIYERACRAQTNFKETLPWAIGLLTLVQVTGDANAATATGGWLYFYARVAYLPLYLSGVPWLRTFMWLASIGGLCMVVLQLL